MNEMANIDIQIVFIECINQYYRKISAAENEITERFLIHASVPRGKARVEARAFNLNVE